MIKNVPSTEMEEKTEKTGKIILRQIRKTIIKSGEEIGNRPSCVVLFEEMVSRHPSLTTPTPSYPFCRA